MAEKLNFELVSPERLLVSAEVDQVQVPGANGDFGVLPGHSPFMSTIRPGVVEVHGLEGSNRFVILGGFADVTPAGLTILAEEAIPVEDLDRADLEKRIQDRREDLADATTDEARQAAQERIDALTTMIEALNL